MHAPSPEPTPAVGAIVGGSGASQRPAGSATDKRSLYPPIDRGGWCAGPTWPPACPLWQLPVTAKPDQWAAANFPSYCWRISGPRSSCGSWGRTGPDRAAKCLLAVLWLPAFFASLTQKLYLCSAALGPCVAVAVSVLRVWPGLFSFLGLGFAAFTSLWFDCPAARSGFFAVCVWWCGFFGCFFLKLCLHCSRHAVVLELLMAFHLASFAVRR